MVPWVKLTFLLFHIFRTMRILQLMVILLWYGLSYYSAIKTQSHIFMRVLSLGRSFSILLWWPINNIKVIIESKNIRDSQYIVSSTESMLVGRSKYSGELLQVKSSGYSDCVPRECWQRLLDGIKSASEYMINALVYSNPLMVHSEGHLGKSDIWKWIDTKYIANTKIKGKYLIATEISKWLYWLALILNFVNFCDHGNLHAYIIDWPKPSNHQIEKCFHNFKDACNIIIPASCQLLIRWYPCVYFKIL